MRPTTVRWLKIPVFAAALWPAANLALGAFGLAGVSLGANPVEAMIDTCGEWGLRFLLITLAITPLKHMTGQVWLHRFRRMLGLFAFFYIALHFLVYSGIDQRFDLAAIVEDIIERPFITIGMTGLLLLIPLALTSTRSMVRRLGRKWQSLHRLVYVIGILGVWHFYWQVKQDVLEPLIYAGILAVLLGWRVYRRWRRRTLVGARSPSTM